MISITLGDRALKFRLCGFRFFKKFVCIIFDTPYKSKVIPLQARNLSNRIWLWITFDLNQIWKICQYSIALWVWKPQHENNNFDFQIWNCFWFTVSQLKVLFKTLYTKINHRCCFSTMNRILVVQVSFWGSDWVWLKFGVFVIKVAFSLTSQMTEKSSFSPKGPTGL